MVGASQSKYLFKGANRISISGLRIEGVITKISHEQLTKYGIVVLHCGASNVPHDDALGFGQKAEKTIMKILELAGPDCYLIVSGMVPRMWRKGDNAVAKAYNDALHQICQKLVVVQYCVYTR